MPTRSASTKAPTSSTDLVALLTASSMVVRSSAVHASVRATPLLVSVLSSLTFQKMTAPSPVSAPTFHSSSKSAASLRASLRLPTLVLVCV